MRKEDGEGEGEGESESTEPLSPGTEHGTRTRRRTRRVQASTEGRSPESVARSCPLLLPIAVLAVSRSPRTLQQHSVKYSNSSTVQYSTAQHHTTHQHPPRPSPRPPRTRTQAHTRSTQPYDTCAVYPRAPPHPIPSHPIPQTQYTSIQYIHRDTIAEWLPAVLYGTVPPCALACAAMLNMHPPVSARRRRSAAVLRCAHCGGAQHPAVRNAHCTATAARPIHSEGFRV